MEVRHYMDAAPAQTWAHRYTGCNWHQGHHHPFYVIWYHSRTLHMHSLHQIAVSSTRQLQYSPIMQLRLSLPLSYLVRTCALTSKGGTVPSSSCASLVAVLNKLSSVSSTLPPGRPQVWSLFLLLRFNNKTLPLQLHENSENRKDTLVCTDRSNATQERRHLLLDAGSSR